MIRRLTTILMCIAFLLFNNVVNGQEKACALLIGSPMPDTIKLKEHSLVFGERLKYDNLTVAVKKDLDSMRTLLLRSGFKEGNITTIPDGNITAAQLRDRIGLLARPLKDSATFVLYFTGHGQQVVDISRDEDDQLDETLVLKADLWIDDQIQILLKSDLKRLKNIFIFDACHSGTVFKLMSHKTKVEKLREKASPPNLVDDWAKSSVSPNQGSCPRFLVEPNEKSYSLLYIGAAGDNEQAKADNKGSWLTQKLSLISKKDFFPTFTYIDLYCLLSSMAQQERKSFSPVYAEIGQNNTTNQPLKLLQ